MRQYIAKITELGAIRDMVHAMDVTSSHFRMLNDQTWLDMAVVQTLSQSGHQCDRLSPTLEASFEVKVVA